MNAPPPTSRELDQLPRWLGAYLLIQALAIAVWWLWMLTIPAARALFLPATWHDQALTSFALPDAFIILLSLWAAFRLFRGQPVTLYLALLHGTIGYGTLYCLLQSFLTHSALAAAGTMSLMWTALALVTLAYHVYRNPSTPFFRVARPAHPAFHFVKTALEVCVFWSLFLFLIPAFLIRFESLLQISRLHFPLQQDLGLCFFLLASLLGLWSGITMSTQGQGTPLPLDAPAQLVLSGPYRYLRNPMALSGLTQALAVALYLGSPFTLFYTLLGALYWDRIVRPLEERDLATRFGLAFETYRTQVPLWLPRRP